MIWQKAYLATCVVLGDLSAADALGPSPLLEQARRELLLDSPSKAARARRLAETLQSTIRALEQMERRWDDAPNAKTARESVS